MGAGACTVTVCTCGAGAVFCGACSGCCSASVSGFLSGSGSGESGALGAVVPKRVTGCGRDSGCQSLRADTVDSVVVAGAPGCGSESVSVLQPVRTRLAVTPVVAKVRNTTECRMRIPLEIVTALLPTPPRRCMCCEHSKAREEALGKSVKGSQTFV